MNRHGFAALLVAAEVAVRADDFTKEDLVRWEKEYMSVVERGRALWVSPELGSNGVACAQCHPNAANTHPETYPKFQRQLGKVIALREMINWCILNPLEGAPLAFDDPDMVAIEAYIAGALSGVPTEIIERQLKYFEKADPAHVKGVRAALK